MARPGLLLVVLGACSAGGSQYRTKSPPPLVPVGVPVAAEHVRVETRDLPWWTLAGDYKHFILKFTESGQTATTGRRIGALRSVDIWLEDYAMDDLRCAWMIVPLGESRPCHKPRSEAMADARPTIQQAFDDLRARAGAAGAALVADVRCWARHDRRGARLWCEGLAVASDSPGASSSSGSSPDTLVGAATAAPPAQGSSTSLFDPTGTSAPAEPPHFDPSAPIDQAPQTKPSRLVLFADGSVGVLGKVAVVASSLGLRYRPIELGLDVVDLSRDGTRRGLVGVGATLVSRIALGGSRADAIGGVSAIAVAPNGATNPSFQGLYEAFVGAAYQTPWRIAGVAQPWLQLRAGVAHGTDLAPRAVPMLDLHLGLSTPERR